jgi:hypothetical protein
MGHYFTSPPKEGILRIFSDARKIQRLRPGLNPRTRVPVASMLTTRPPNQSQEPEKNGTNMGDSLRSKSQTLRPYGMCDKLLCLE